MCLIKNNDESVEIVMRSAQKKQAMEFAELLGEAHKEIKKAMEGKKQAAAMKLLEQCQEGAIELGNMIEESEGEGFATVHLLEDYCELLYQLHEKNGSDRSSDAGRDYKLLQKALIQIINSVRNDIPVRLEVVFLPYKASMWDSLESVWKAADSDENTDAYVIPIPYFDKNPDGSLREEHYEGGLYPEYVSITRYDEYDFKNRRPDVIYIHNPYDDCNFVTSVHPFFYSKNLKQFTEKLVYIPYFILGEISPDNREAVEGIKHFCTTPGVINADKVIVQSEAMRQVYVNVLTEETLKSQSRRNEKEIRRYWENKIDGSGSPKFDKILNTRKEQIEIPEEWKGVIEKPDGTWKKIILYNTSVTALLQNNEKALRKMEDVFRIFYENRNDAALLWRPHPLLESTLNSMRPQLLEEYKRVRDRYIGDGWGIYDDTADLDRAIVLSDGYYGDGSSLVELCRKMKKPVMIQNVEICSQCKKVCKEGEI